MRITSILVNSPRFLHRWNISNCLWTMNWLITFQSNLYVTQLSQQNSTRAIKSFTKSEIKSTIGIILLMGIYKLPNRRMYWAPYSKVSIIADTIPRNRFKEILRHLHYSDNSFDLNKNDPSHNKLFKIQPLIDIFARCFSQPFCSKLLSQSMKWLLLLKEGILLKFIYPRNVPNGGIRYGAAIEYQDIRISLKYLEVKVHQVSQQIASPCRREGKVSLLCCVCAMDLSLANARFSSTTYFPVQNS